MQRIRLWIARVLGLMVFVVTLGRVEIDWSASRAHVRGADEAGVAQRADGAADGNSDSTSDRRPAQDQGGD